MIQKTVQPVGGEDVLREYPAVGKYRIRLLRDRTRKLVLDVREYVSGDSFEGFTRRGVRLGALEDLRALLEQLRQGEADWSKEKKD